MVLDVDFMNTLQMEGKDRNILEGSTVNDAQLGQVQHHLEKVLPECAKCSFTPSVYISLPSWLPGS